jgi:hypothetical protein
MGLPRAWEKRQKQKEKPLYYRRLQSTDWKVKIGVGGQVL